MARKRACLFVDADAPEHPDSPHVLPFRASIEPAEVRAEPAFPLLGSPGACGAYSEFRPVFPSIAMTSPPKDSHAYPMNTIIRMSVSLSFLHLSTRVPSISPNASSCATACSRGWTTSGRSRYVDVILRAVKDWQSK